MNEKQNPNAARRITVSLPPDTAAMLEELKEARSRRLSVATGKDKCSQIVREGIEIMYRYEILNEDIVRERSMPEQ